MPGRLTFVAPCLLLLSGCGSIVIVQPQGAQPSAPSPVPVSFDIEITKSVYGRSATVNGMAINLGAFASTIKPGTQNTEVLTGTLPFPPGSYTLTVSGTYDQWNGTAQATSTSSNFTVTASTPTPTVSLTVSPATGDILVPRNGSSPQMTFTIARTNSTGAVNITAPDLPTGVTLPATSVGGTATTATAKLSATAIANGRTDTHFTAKMTGAADAVEQHWVNVVPVAGNIAWVAAPFLTNGPATPTSPDGRFKVTASRIGAQRVWTLHIVATSGNNPPSLDVTAAQWGGAGGSNLMGIAFCPSTTATTLSALVLSDEDEDPNTTTHANSVTYRLKVIRFDGGTPRLTGSIDGLFYRGGVQPWLGFSADCSIVAGWTTDTTGSNARAATFFDIFNNQNTTFNFTDTAQQPAASLAKITGANINLTPPTGPAQSHAVP